MRNVKLMLNVNQVNAWIPNGEVVSTRNVVKLYVIDPHNIVPMIGVCYGKKVIISGMCKKKNAEGKWCYHAKHCKKGLVCKREGIKPNGKCVQCTKDSECDQGKKVCLNNKNCQEGIYPENHVSSKWQECKSSICNWKRGNKCAECVEGYSNCPSSKYCKGMKCVNKKKNGKNVMEAGNVKGENVLGGSGGTTIVIS